MAARSLITPRHSGNAPARPERRRAGFAEYLARARGEEALGRFLLAASAYSEAGRLYPRDVRPILGRGRALRAAGFLVEARRALRRGLESCPRSPELLLELGEDELCEGRAARAVPLFRRVLDIQPDCRHARLRLAVSLYLTGEKRRAVKALAH